MNKSNIINIQAISSDDIKHLNCKTGFGSVKKILGVKGMNEMRFMAEEAKKFADTELNGELSLEALKKFIETNGYIFHVFDEENLCDDELLIEVKCTSLARYRVAFTYNGPGITFSSTVKAVFVSNKVSVCSLMQVVLHEVAHIYLGHLGGKKSNFADREIEANLFSYFVTNYCENAISYKTKGGVINA